MKQKIILFIVLIMTVFTLTSCGGDVNPAGEDSTEAVTLKKDIPEGDFSDMGNGTFYISFPSGTSENGNIPIEYVEKSALAGSKMEDCIEVAITTNDFDATKLTKIYVDGVLQDTLQLGNTQTSFFPNVALTTVGTHTVEALQFDENNNVVTYKSAQYKIMTIE